MCGSLTAPLEHLWNGPRWQAKQVALDVLSPRLSVLNPCFGITLDSACGRRAISLRLFVSRRTQLCYISVGRPPAVAFASLKHWVINERDSGSVCVILPCYYSVYSCLSSSNFVANIGIDVFYFLKLNKQPDKSRWKVSVLFIIFVFTF